LIPFVCIREKRFTYRSVGVDKIVIHPGSVLFGENPDFIVGPGRKLVQKTSPENPNGAGFRGFRPFKKKVPWGLLWTKIPIPGKFNPPKRFTNPGKKPPGKVFKGD